MRNTTKRLHHVAPNDAVGHRNSVDRWINFFVEPINLNERLIGSGIMLQEDAIFREMIIAS